MHYIARLAHAARARLAPDEGATVGEVAVRLGYGSEAAFARAFKRVMGFAPGAARRPPAPGASLAL
jgi:AraC-like DNA-binding protein